MPCHTQYSGRQNYSKPKPFARTEIDVDLTMSDELGNVHGYIRSADDYTIRAIVLDSDGITVLHERKYFLIEKPEDKKLCKKNNYVGVEGTASDLIQKAKEWVTNQYQTYIHSHEKPQEVFQTGTIVGG